MLPPDGVLLAANRWIELLRTGESIGRAWAIIKNSPKDVPLTATQYATALEWLSGLGVIDGDGHLRAADSSSSIESLLFSRCIEALRPPWLIDADLLVPSPAELPVDVERLAGVFALTDDAAFVAVQNTNRKVDSEIRAQIGARGELGLIALLEEKWPGSTTHVSAFDDSAGYDIALDLPEGCWHIEVKTTTRKGRLSIHLSRNEYATGYYDDKWVLAIVGLTDGAVTALATMHSRDSLDMRVPRNVHAMGRWEVCGIDLRCEDLSNGLVLDCGRPTLSLLLPRDASAAEFVWLPPASAAVG
jgi:hypothetical protein